MIPIQPWMIKGGAVAILLSAVFYGGCHTQKKLDAAKILRLKADYSRAVGIIDTLQVNEDTLEQAIKDQNESIAKQGEEYNRKVVFIEAAHEEAIAKLNRSNEETVRAARDEATALRERMVGLSLGEACHEAMKEIASD